MEYVLFRILRLIEREVSLYEKLLNCIIHQNSNLKNGKMIDLLVDRIEQKAAVLEISDIERDVKEEINELSDLLEIKTDEPNITVIVDNLQHKYPKFCGKFSSMSNQINELLTNIDLANTENMELLKLRVDICCDVIPMIDTWEDFEAFLETELENLDLCPDKQSEENLTLEHA